MTADAHGDFTQQQPLFLVGLWRSGTTLGWHLLRMSPGFRCYFEPLHEYLVDHAQSRSEGGDRDAWEEYRSLDQERLAALWQPWFARERFRLEPDDAAPDLARYLRFLVDTARPGERAALKFVRAGLRARWLRAQFPDARIIHITRSPRDVWSSAMGRHSKRSDEVEPADDTWGVFPSYFRMMANDIGLYVEGHPYRRLYALWLMCEESIASVADDRWAYEEIVTDLHAWGRAHLVDTGLCRAVPDVDVWRESIGPTFHEPGWYEEQEAEVRRIFDTDAFRAKFRIPQGTRSA